MDDKPVPPTIASVTPTLCALLGIPPPEICRTAALSDVVRSGRNAFGGANAERCLVYAPDAIGDHLRSVRPEILGVVAELAPVRAHVRAVVPPKTPVCFASMFTGAAPADHGIRRYERPTLTCDTFFDAAVRAGLRVAIAAVADSSIDLIFRGRNLDYYSEASDAGVTARVRDLLQTDGHDCIIAYEQEYDDRLHVTTPFSVEAMQAARAHAAAFRELVELAKRHWSRRRRMWAFTPDHGAHLDAGSGTGTHGDDIPEDMNVTHFWGFGRP